MKEIEVGRKDGKMEGTKEGKKEGRKETGTKSFLIIINKYAIILLIVI